MVAPPGKPLLTAHILPQTGKSFIDFILTASQHGIIQQGLRNRVDILGLLYLALPQPRSNVLGDAQKRYS
jgi:hypothetical protein